MAAIAVPVVRARHMKNIVEALEALPQPRQDALMRALDAADLRAVREASATEWLDVGINVRMSEAIWRGSERPASERFFRDLMLRDFQSSYLKSLVASAIQLFGPSPGAFVKWVPRGWGTMFRDCGEVEARDVTQERARLVYTHLAPALVGSSVWLETVCASMSALFQIGNAVGDVLVEEQNVAARRAALLFRWQARRRAEPL